MGVSGAVIFNSAVNQIQSSAKNLQAISEAKRRRQQEDTIFDLKKQEAQIKLKQAEATGQTTDLQNQFLKTQMDQYFKQQDTINKGKDAQITQVEHQQTQAGQQADKVARHVAQNDPMVRSMLAERLNPSLAQGGAVMQPNASQSGQMMESPQGQDMNQDNTPEAVPSTLQSTPKDLLQPTQGKGGFSFKSGTNGYRNSVIAKKIEQIKASGGQLTPDEQAFDIKMRFPDYKRGAVVSEARKMALDEAKSNDPGAKGISADAIRKFIPEAEKMLYGETVTQPESSSKPFNDNVGGFGRIKDIGGTNKGKASNDEKVYVQAPDGTYGYLPAANVDKALKRGFKRVNR